MLFHYRLASMCKNISFWSSQKVGVRKQTIVTIKNIVHDFYWANFFFCQPKFVWGLKIFNNFLRLVKYLFFSMIRYSTFLLRFALYATYRIVIRPVLCGQCRFTPSCSSYAFKTFAKYSFGQALKLVAKRLLQCHPWGEHWIS
jgi:putative membrane protein insertion efficiency factor